MKRRKAMSAGWGFSLIPYGPAPEVDDDPVLTACGPVRLEHDHRLFIGARKLSNNTGELSAVVEALLWLLAECEAAEMLSDLPAVLHTDSKYVIGILTKKFTI